METNIGSKTSKSYRASLRLAGLQIGKIKRAAQPRQRRRCRKVVYVFQEERERPNLLIAE